MKRFIKLTIVLLLTFTTIHAETLKDFVKQQKPSQQKPFYQGEVVTVLQANAYTYLEIKEATTLTFWVATNGVDAKVGDYVRFQKELITQNFKSTTLKRTFKELMFVSHLEYRK